MKALVSDQWLEKGSAHVRITELKLGNGNYPAYCDECHGLITLQEPSMRFSWLNGTFFAKTHESCAEFDQEVLLW